MTSMSSRQWTLLIPIVLLLSCSGARNDHPLVGTWNLVEPEEMKGMGGPKPTWELRFNEDGTFTEHVENRIMMTLIADTKGTYSLRDDKVTLEGTSTTYMDDGYKKDTETEKVRRTMRLEKGSLFEQRHSRMEFRRR